MLIARSLPEVNETLPADRSVPAFVGFSAPPAAPGVSSSVVPPLLSDPPLTTISALLVRTIAVAAGRVMSAVTVIGPLFPSPIRIVPGVTRSNSASDRLSGPPIVSVAVPRSIATPLVNGRSVTVLDALVLTEAPSRVPCCRRPA